MGILSISSHVLIGIILWISVTSTPWISGRGLHVKQWCHVLSCHIMCLLMLEKSCVSLCTHQVSWRLREQCLPEQSTGISHDPRAIWDFCFKSLSPARVEMLLGTMWMGLEDICGLPPSMHFSFLSGQLVISIPVHVIWVWLQPPGSLGFRGNPSVNSIQLSTVTGSVQSEWTSVLLWDERIHVLFFFSSKDLTWEEVSLGLLQPLCLGSHMEPKMKPPQRRWEWGVERNHALRVLAGADSNRIWSENTPDLKTLTWGPEATLGVSLLEVLFCPCFRKNPNRYNRFFYPFLRTRFRWSRSCGSRPCSQGGSEGRGEAGLR